MSHESLRHHEIDLETLAPHEAIATSLDSEGLYAAARLKPETYPGDSPEGTGFLVAGKAVYELAFNPTDDTEGEFDPQIITNEGSLSLDEYFIRNGIPQMSERYPVVSFGSNRCPGQIYTKFEGAERSDVARASLTTVPSFKAVYKGADVVHTKHPGMLGYSYAELYISPETAETEVEVSIAFLTEEQLKFMHTTEGGYMLGEHGNVKLGASIDSDQSDGYEIPAVFYAGHAEVGKQNGSVIAMSEVRAKNRNLSEKDQYEAVRDFFAYDPSGQKAEAIHAMEALLELKPPADYDESLKETMKPDQWAEYVYRKSMRVNAAGGTIGLQERRDLKAMLNEAMSPEESLDVSPVEAVDTVHIQRMTTLRTLGEAALGIPANSLNWGADATNSRFRGTENLDPEIAESVIKFTVEKDKAA